MTCHTFITPHSVLSKLKGTKTQFDKPGCANYDRWYLFQEAHEVGWKLLWDRGVFLWPLSARINLQYPRDCKLLFAGVGPAYWMGLWTFITIDPDLAVICSAQSRSLMFQFWLRNSHSTCSIIKFYLYVPISIFRIDCWVQLLCWKHKSQLVQISQT